MSFPCTGCGACCTKLPQRLSAILPLDEEGTCANYDARHRNCRIYETRPLICRIDGLFEQIGCTEEGMTRERFYAQQAEHCNRRIREEGLPDQFLVKLGSAALP